MLIKHENNKPILHESAYIAHNATICGKVKIGKNSRIMFGVTIIAEGGKITIGDNCVILENAVLRSTSKFDLHIENNVLIGPHAHVVGSTIENNVFIATGASIFHGSVLKEEAEVRINGVVHIKSVLEKGTTVPIGWIAVGTPAQVFPPDKHDKIWMIQEKLNFPLSVYGVDRNGDGESIMPAIMEYMSNRLKSHKEDEVIE